MLGPFLFAFFVLALAVTGFFVWQLVGRAADLGERLAASERECDRLRVLLKQIEEADGEHEDDLEFRRATREIRLSRWRSSHGSGPSGPTSDERELELRRELEQRQQADRERSARRIVEKVSSRHEP